MLADLVFFIAIFAGWGQQPPRPPDSPIVTASIAGTIVTDEQNSRPLSRAVVTLSGAALRPSLVAITDDAGRFAFSGLAAGNVTLTASKPPYLTIAYGQTVPGQGSGVPIAVEEGQQIADLTIELPRGAVISGRIFDHRGQPLRHAPITVMEYRTVNGKRILWSLGTAWPPTDTGGMYRVYGLAPGSYIVSAYPPGDYLWFPGASAGPFTPGGGPTTGLSDLREVTEAEMRWALQQLRAPGRGGIPAATDTPAAEPPPGQTVAYGAVYYPGTSDPTDAALVTVDRGEERTGIDFAMPLNPTALVAGRVVGADGQPAANVRLSFGSPGGGTMSWSSPDGTFSMPNLLSGQYQITAQAAGSTVTATSEVSVTGRDMTDVVLNLQPRTTIAGRVAVDAGVLRRLSDLTTVRVVFSPVQDGPLPIRSSVRADGTFESSIVPASYRLTVSVWHPPGSPGSPGSNDGWTVKSAIVNGRDVSDVPFEIRPNQSVSDVVVTLTDRAAELSGRVLDASGRPAQGYYVVLFSTDPAFRTPGARRFPAPVRSATDGTFRFAGLPPGAYYVAALAELNQSSLSDDGFLVRVAASATVVTLADGEKKVQDLILPRGGAAADVVGTVFAERIALIRTLPASLPESTFGQNRRRVLRELTHASTLI